jgi:alkanesulfonate monooxygenase SsuD/methylene tetrahydromethanopterin reductase-like flavin-dependent oxidoreductase (luciferase family)
LLEGSWEPDAVVRDYERGVFADPRTVHNIEPVEGRYDHVVGPHVCEPSVQRVPFLFQAGSSSDGREFSARNAEAVFQAAPNANGVRIYTENMHERMAAHGRQPDDVIVCGSIQAVFGATEEEAQRKDAELLEYHSEEHVKAFYSSTMNFDLGSIDVNKPLGEFETNALQGHLKQIVESMPNKQLSFRDYYMLGFKNRFVGTAEQFADKVEELFNAGVRGLNVILLSGIADLKVLSEHVAPVLQDRGLMQSDYGPYQTLREKMFDGKQGSLTNERHPSARYRHGVRIGV